MASTGQSRPLSPQPRRWRPERSSEPGARVLDLGRLLIALTVVAVGVLFLLDGAGVIDAGDAIGDWWPTLFVAAGVLTLVERPPSLVRGAILVAAGAALLLFTTDVVGEGGWDYAWPALVILVGLLIASRWRGRSIAAGVEEGDLIRSTAVFGGPKLVSTARRFQGAWLTAVFGGISLDLRGAQPCPEGASVNITAVFGGVDVIVPTGWRISVRSTPIFGGLENRIDHSVELPDDAPALHVDAVTIFGGVKIAHRAEDE